MDTLVVLAGGRGARSGEGRNKVFADLGGKPLLWYPLTAARALEDMVEVVLVIRPSDRSEANEVVARVPGLRAEIVAGGESRAESEARGIEAAAAESGLIGIHDGARPFLTTALWHRLVRAAIEVGGAVPVISQPAAFRLVGGALSQQQDIARAQTPQVFEALRLIRAHRRSNQSALDTAQVVMAFDQDPVAAVDGDPRNLKVTYPADLVRARQLASDWRQGAWLNTI